MDWLLLLRASSTITALIGATVLAAMKREGWGWMLFVVLLIAPTR